MSAISLKSITGITSITTPAGVDNVFTVHTNDTTERFRVDQTGNLNIAGIVTVTKDLDVDGHTNLDNLSIAGVTTASGNITIENVEPTLYLTDSNNNSDFAVRNNDGTFGIRDTTNGVERLVINSAGEVGISVSPASGHLLHIKNAGSADSKVKIESESGYDARLILDTSNGGGAGGHIDFQIDGTLKGGIQYVSNASASDTHDIIFRNNTNAERLRITSDGNVGVNTSSVSIAGMSRYLSVSARNVTNGGAAVELVGARTGSDQSLGVINFVNQTSNVAEIRAKYQGSTTLGSLHFSTSGSEKLQITSGGNLLIDTTVTTDAPANDAGDIIIGTTSDTQKGITIVGSTSGGIGNIFFSDGAGYNNQGRIAYYHADDSMRFTTNVYERLRINSSGNVGVNTDFTGSQTWRSGNKLEIFGGGGNVTGELHLGANRGDGAQSVGSINFFDNTQDSTHRHIAIIEADKVGSTSNKRGGDLLFYTKGDNVAAPTVKFRITSAGQLGVGVAAPTFAAINSISANAARGIEIYKDGTDTGSAIKLAGDNGSGNKAYSQLGYSGANATAHWANYNTGGTKVGEIVIGSTGLVGINDATPDTRLSVIHEGGGGTAYDVLTLGGSTAGNNTFPKIKFVTVSNNNTTGRIGIFDAGATNSFAGDFVVELNTGSNGDSTSEKFRVKHDGSVNIGNPGGYAIWNALSSDVKVQLELRHTVGVPAGMAILEERGDSNGTNLILGKSRGGNGVGVINSGDTLGSIKFSGADGTRQHNGAAIVSWTSGTIATGRVPANLSFYTAPDSVSGYLERFRILSDSSLLHIRSDNTTRYDFEFRNTGGISDGNYGGIKFTQGNSGATGLAAMRIAYSNAGQPDIAFETRHGGGNTLTDSLRIHQNGDLSMPTVGAKLYTNNSGGNLTIQGGATYPGSAIKFVGGTNGGTGRMHFYAGTGTGLQERVRIYPSGAAGVDIFGEAAQDDSTSGARGIDISTSGSASQPVYFGTEHNAAQKSMYMSGYWIIIRGHQNEGIKFRFSQGSGAPRSDTYLFKYDSAIRPGSSNSWDGFSDVRAKENVVSMTNGIDTIKKLRPVIFDWTDDYADSQTMYIMGTDENGGTIAKKENGYDTNMKNGKYGFIAQEFETVFPKDIRQNKFTLGGTELTDFKTINHDSLIPTLTAALKEAVAKIETLEAKVAALEGS